MLSFQPLSESRAVTDPGEREGKSWLLKVVVTNVEKRERREPSRRELHEPDT
jgi:hypothetical protein